jgi:hypothetical protein
MTDTQPTSGLLVIPVDGPTRVVAVPTDDTGTLGILQREVDGYVECLAIGDATTSEAGVDMWLNEEGKFRDDFHQNDRAMLLAFNHFGPLGDVIVGPVVLGRTNSEGETTALSEDDITAIRATFDMLGEEV